MGRIHDVSRIRTDGTYLHLTVDGRAYRLPWRDCSPRFAQASQHERRRIEVSPSGYGLLWPLIDEDLATGPLIVAAGDIPAETS